MEGLALLAALCRTPGIPGREEAIRELVRKELEDYADDLFEDQMGNLFALRKGEGVSPRSIMLAAHMDEIGFLVRYISKEGFLYFQPIGGFDPRTLVAQRVKVYGREVIDGIIGIKPAHFSTEEERKKAVPIDQLFIDVGMSADRVKAIVQIGDMITLEREFIELGDCVTSKTLDDRVGVYVMIEAFRRFQSSHDDIYAVATVQEEIGLRGAQTAAFGLDPDIGLAIDITIAADIPGIDEKDHCTRLGQGVAIKIMDSHSISDLRMVNFLRSLAEEYQIPYQMEILPRGGTDAGAMQRSREGIPVCTISIPTRYTHSVVETAHKGDIEAAIALLCAFLENSDRFPL